ncbi:uncharacterized protein [Watersipora subatra]|uniref:uncharacterized protein n=1 Tax=Watersipora subatra TaxID=2589382 RepID=UPI00355C17D9
MGRPAHFLIDSGCTSNLLSRHVFDRLPAGMKAQLVKRTDYGTMADGSRLNFHGMLTVPIRVRSVQVTVSLLVCPLKEDAIIGMPFLTDQCCEMNFQESTLVVNGQKLICTDRDGRPLVSKVQVVRTMTLQPRSEMVVTCRLTTHTYQPLGMVEGSGDRYMVAASLHLPDEKGRVALRCLNPTDSPVQVASGTVIGSYTGVDETEIGQPWTEGGPKGAKPSQDTRPDPKVAPHVKELYSQAIVHCRSDCDRQQVVRLLDQYADVFSKGDGDVGRTTLVQHEIPTISDAQPIRQTPYRVGPEKEAEIDRQVSELAKQGMIEQAYGAWSSPVVLVRKKD